MARKIKYQVFTAKDESPDCDRCDYELSFEEDSICCTKCGSGKCWAGYKRTETEAERVAKRLEIIRRKKCLLA